MRDCTRWSLRCQVEWLCKQYAQYGDLPFSNVLSKKLVLETLGSVGGRYYDSLYNPVVTLWIFLTQMISADRLTNEDPIRTPFEYVRQRVRKRQPLGGSSAKGT